MGDRLRRKIDEGLARSRYGIVVLSKNFFSKHWPQEELDGLAQREVSGRKVILPIWLDVGYADVREYSPTLADRMAARADLGLPEVVRQLTDVLREDTKEGSRVSDRQGSTAPQRQQTDDAIWAALASVMGAGRYPVIGAGMMKITVPGVVQELVVDAQMLVEALKDGPLSRREVCAMSGGVYDNLGMAIADAEKQGLVMDEPMGGSDRIMLTAKGRLLVRILEEEKRLQQSWSAPGSASEPLRAEPSAKAPSQVAITPAEIDPGGSVNIVPLGWLPAGDLESLRCSVQGPRGTVWTKEIHQDLRGGIHGKLVFPNDFEAASTKEQGVYIVRADRISGDGQVMQWGPEGVFRVSGALTAS